MDSKEQGPKLGPRQSQWKTFAFWFSVVAIIISGITLWDNNFRSNIKMFIGKQVRLYVVRTPHPHSPPRPALFAALSCFNSGGRAMAIRDTKLAVRIITEDRQVRNFDFQAEREVSNFLYAEGDSEQHPATPLLVLGKSMASKQIVYTPSEPIPQADIPESFDLEFDLHIKCENDWQVMATYQAPDVQGVWQDLSSGPPYHWKIMTVGQRGDSDCTMSPH